MSPTPDNNAPKGHSKKTRCLDCGCEFQAIGDGEQPNTCPICSAGASHVENADELKWVQLLQHKPGNRSSSRPYDSPETIEVEANSATPHSPSPPPSAPARSPGPHPVPADDAPADAPPRPGPWPAHGSPESTGDLLKELRESGFQVNKDPEDG
jgi:hypothetical protein